MTPARKSRCIAYIRTSTDKQDVSPDVQAERIRSYAATYDLDVVDTVVEVASAATLKRPGLQGALRALKAGKAEGLLVLKLDRLTRSVRDLADLLEGHFAEGRHHLYAVQDHVDTSTANGRMILTLLTTIGQWEREAIGERTKAAMGVMRSRRERVGAIPYGSRLAADGVHLEPEPKEQAIVTRVKRWRSGGATVRAIAEKLRTAGTPARGKAWHPTTVARILAREEER